MKDTDRKKLETDLYDIASKIVCKRGKSTSSAISVTGEEYITYKCRFKKLYDIRAWFDNLVTLKLNECATDYGLETPVIYWRVKPEITKHNEPKKMFLEDLKRVLLKHNAAINSSVFDSGSESNINIRSSNFSEIYIHSLTPECIGDCTDSYLEEYELYTRFLISTVDI